MKCQVRHPVRVLGVGFGLWSCYPSSTISLNPKSFPPVPEVFPDNVYDGATYVGGGVAEGPFLSGLVF